MMKNNMASITYIMKKTVVIYNDLANIMMNKELSKYPLAEKFIKKELDNLNDIIGHCDAIIKTEKLDK